MRCNDAGRMIVKWWNELPHKIPSITVDEFVVMPNHIHGILFLHKTVGPTCVSALIWTRPLAHVGAPLPEIIQWFKTMTTNEYIRGVKQLGWVAFPGKLWQQNYYEQIIRNQRDYERIADYILTNWANWKFEEEKEP
jgi:putative transposase